MPFWQQCKRCENCRFWHAADPSDTEGVCRYLASATMVPAWTHTVEAKTRFDDGKECPVYRHQPDRPHPLERAEGIVAGLLVGDRITLRTYERGAVSREKGLVVRHAPEFLLVDAFNTRHRLRRRTAVRGYAGTLVGMESWGIDMDAPIEREPPPKEHPDRAAGMLAKVRKGQWLPLLGYPPFEGQRIRARVLSVHPGHIFVRIKRRKARMYRKDPLAGIIEGEAWVLDTTGEQE